MRKEIEKRKVGDEITVGSLVKYEPFDEGWAIGLVTSVSDYKVYFGVPYTDRNKNEIPMLFITMDVQIDKTHPGCLIEKGFGCPASCVRLISEAEAILEILK